MATPRSVRFDESVVARLASYVSRHPGLTASSVAARLVDEGLRMEEHPGVMFRDGPMGRRATLVGGPDVWEVIRALRSARTAEPDLAAVPQRPDLMALHDDEPILAAATAEGRIMVTTNIGDFAVLDGRWAAEGRTHAGIVFVTTSAFPQDRSFIGSVVNALHAA